MKEKKGSVQELEFIRDWCLIVLDFLMVKDSNFKDFAEITKRTFANYAIVNNQKMLIGYRQGFRDINDFAKALKLSEYQELNKILFEKFGKTIMNFDSKLRKKIESILKRKKILDNEECELIENKVSDLSQGDDKEKEIEVLNKLLVDYQKENCR